MFWIRFGTFFGHNVLKLFLKFVGNDGEGIDGHLVIWDIGLLNVSATGKTIEIITRFNFGFHFTQHRGGGVNTFGGQTDIGFLFTMATRLSLAGGVGYLVLCGL